MSATHPTPPRLVLASASPRRRELLARLGVDFEVRPVDADETPRPGEAPEPLVRRLALAKARAAARPGELALGADTVVAIENQILGKPLDAEDARLMLRALSGRTHDVWTGIALVADGRELAHAERTRVTFLELPEESIAAYVASGEPLDKAGAYAIQGGASSFVERVDGDFTNVVGLPLSAVQWLLAKLETPP